MRSLPGSMGLLLPLAGLLLHCSPQGEDPAPEEAATHPEAVVVSFYKGSARTAVCSGTLVSPRVVITSAHCASGSDGARVTAPDFHGRTSTVSSIKTHDWVIGGANSPADSNDIALLTLRTSLRLARYPKLQKSACVGCTAVLASHSYGSRASASSLSFSKPTQAQKTPPRGREAQLLFGKGSTDAGGAVYRNYSTTLVGLVVGKGKVSGGGYVAPVSSPRLQAWVSATIVAAASAAQKVAPKTASSRLLDEYSGDEAPAEDYDPGQAPEDLEAQSQEPDVSSDENTNPYEGGGEGDHADGAQYGEADPSSSTDTSGNFEDSPDASDPGSEGDAQPGDEGFQPAEDEAVDSGYSGDESEGAGGAPDDGSGEAGGEGGEAGGDSGEAGGEGGEAGDSGEGEGGSGASGSDPTQQNGFDEGVTPASGYAQNSVQANNLKAAADYGMNGNENNCSGSVAKTLSKLGNNELNGKVANEQVAYMQQNWKAVSAQEAQQLANSGTPVVAGLANPSGHGHVAVVVPGNGAIKPDGNFYPNVQGGSLSGAGTSWGNKTAGDVWNTKDRSKVQYYTPSGTQI